MLHKLKILLYGDVLNDRLSQGMDYITFLSAYGAVTLITPESLSMIGAEVLETFDVLALPGGADVNPLRYDEYPMHKTGRTNPQYEWMDLNFLPHWIETGKPIIGICRGAQTLNVALGGSLIQHINGHVGGVDRTEVQHNVYTDIIVHNKKDSKSNPSTVDYRAFGINSYHHQAIGRLGEGVTVLGWSCLYKNCPSVSPVPHPHVYAGTNRWKKNKQGVLVKEDGIWSAIPEIIGHETKPYIAFQYHPENTNCPLAHHLITKTLSKFYEDEN